MNKKLNKRDKYILLRCYDQLKFQDYPLPHHYFKTRLTHNHITLVIKLKDLPTLQFKLFKKGKIRNNPLFLPLFWNNPPVFFI